MSKLFREGGPSGSGKRWEWIDRSTTADGRLTGLFGLSKRLLFFLSGDFFSIKNTMMGAGKRILGQSQSEGSKRNSAPVHHAKSWKVQSKATSFRCSPSTVRALSTHPPRHIPLPSRPLHNWAPKLVLFLSHLHLHLHLQNTHTHCLTLFETVWKGSGSRSRAPLPFVSPCELCELNSVYSPILDWSWAELSLVESCSAFSCIGLGCVELHVMACFRT